MGGVDKVTQHLLQLLPWSHKTKETITGIDEIITKVRKAAGNLLLR